MTTPTLRKTSLIPENEIKHHHAMYSTAAETTAADKRLDKLRPMLAAYAFPDVDGWTRSARVDSDAKGVEVIWDNPTATTADGSTIRVVLSAGHNKHSRRFTADVHFETISPDNIVRHVVIGVGGSRNTIDRYSRVLQWDAPRFSMKSMMRTLMSTAGLVNGADNLTDGMESEISFDPDASGVLQWFFDNADTAAAESR